MVWEAHEPQEGRKRRHLPPTVVVTPTGLVLNRRAVDLVGTDKRAVILYYNKETESMGLWFWVERQDAGDKANKCYAVTHYEPLGIAKITAKSYVREHDLIQRAKRIGRPSFLLQLDKDWATGGEFYTAKIE